MHYWGDDWPYWDDLYEAQEYFINLYQRCTGKYPHTKEKYGTIRFEATFIWITTDEHVRIFREAIRRTVKKFPNVAGEICSSAGHVLIDKYFTGWCAGVTFQANGSYWISDKRPRGV